MNSNTIFLIVLIVCVPLMIFLSIKIIKDSDGKKQKKTTDKKTINGIPKAKLIYPLINKDIFANEKFSDFLTDVLYFMLAIMKSTDILCINNYVICDIFTLCSFVVRFKFKNVLTDEEIKTKIVSKLITEAPKTLCELEKFDKLVFYDLYIKRHKELTSIYKAETKYSFDLMDLVSDMSICLGYECALGKYSQLQTSAVRQVLLTDETYYYLVYLTKLLDSISELCDNYAYSLLKEKSKMSDK